MKPCKECLKQFGKPRCTLAGCCVFKDVLGMSTEQALLGADISETFEHYTSRPEILWIE